MTAFGVKCMVYGNALVSEIFFSKLLNLGPNQCTLKIFSNCVKFGTKLKQFEFFFVMRYEGTSICFMIGTFNAL